MREHRLHQFGLGSLKLLTDSISLDQLRDLRADHMRPQQFAGLGIEHCLDEAFCLTQRNRLAIADEGEVADLDRIAGFLCLGLGHTDTCNLRMAICTARDIIAVERMRMNFLIAEFLWYCI